MTKWEYHIVEHFGGLFLDKMAHLGQLGWEIIQVDEIKRADINSIAPYSRILYESGYKLYLKRPVLEWTPEQRAAAEEFHDR